MDTSVVINLLATGRMSDIVGCLGINILVPSQVRREVLRDPISKLPLDENNHPLDRVEGVKIVALSASSLALFLSLVEGEAAHGLGDGEAAAIAHAATGNHAVAIDERKARRILHSHFSEISLVSSIEILTSPLVAAALTSIGAQKAIDDANMFGRMHIPRDLRP